VTSLNACRTDRFDVAEAARSEPGSGLHGVCTPRSSSLAAPVVDAEEPDVCFTTTFWAVMTALAAGAATTDAGGVARTVDRCGASEAGLRVEARESALWLRSPWPSVLWCGCVLSCACGCALPLRCALGCSFAFAFAFAFLPLPALDLLSLLARRSGFAWFFAGLLVCAPAEAWCA